MKKLIVAAMLMLAAVAHADVAWSWWLENKTDKADISFGLVTRIAEVDAFEFSLLYGGSPVKDGLQWSLFGINDGDSDCALQLSWLFNRGKDPSVQLGCINVDKTSVFDLGFVNVADDAKVQLGFLNFNKNGLLPVFPFINLSKSLFN